MNRRDFGRGLGMMSLTAGLPAAAQSSAAASRDEEFVPWYRKLKVGIEIGPTGNNDGDDIFMSKATGKEWIEQLVVAKAQYAVLFMKDFEFAFYASRIARQCPNLKGRDLLRECFDEAAKHEMPIIVYQQIQYDSAAWRKFPDYRMQDVDGKDIPNRLCYNRGYLEHSKLVADELMEYEIAGFHFDMLDYGFGKPYGCWCPTCRDLFQKQHGVEMPRKRTWDELWEKFLQFRYASNSSFCNELRAYVHSKNPRISVDFNYHGYPPFDWQVGELPIPHSAMSDFVTAEGLPWAFGYTMPSLITLFMVASHPEGLAQGVTWRGIREYHDYTVRPAIDIKAEVMTYLAHGAFCTIVDKADYEGTLDHEAYRRMGEAFGEARAKSEYFGHRPVREAGIYFSERTRDWYGQGDETPAKIMRVERMPTQKYYQSFLGAHSAMVEGHIPCGILFDGNLSVEKLREFPVAYLPNAACLTEKQAGLLREYVETGGNLLATGLTGLYDGMGRPRKESVIAELIGAKFVRRMETKDHYFRFDTPDDELGRALQRDIPSDWFMLAWGDWGVFEPNGAQAIGRLWLPHRTPKRSWEGEDPHRAMSAKEAVGPAVFVNQVGEGRVVYIPASPDASWGAEYRMPEHRLLIRNVIRYLNPAPPVVVDAPSTVEIVVTKDDAGRRWIIHFLSGVAGGVYTRGLSPHSLGPVQEPRLYKASVEVRSPIRSVKVLGAGTKAKRKGRTIRLQTDEVHEALVIGV